MSKSDVYLVLSAVAVGLALMLGTGFCIKTIDLFFAERFTEIEVMAKVQLMNHAGEEVREVIRTLQGR